MTRSTQAAVARSAASVSLGAALALALVSAATAQQAPAWRVVASENAQVLVPGMPTSNGRNVVEPLIGDVGRGLVGFRIDSPSALEGYWAAQGGQIVRYTQLGNAGAFGPGRSGAEASHVFLSVNGGWGGASPDGQRNFLARAGDPAATLNASYGLWRWDGARNIEVARTLTDGAFGPGLGTDWEFPNRSGFATARMLSRGRMLIYGEVLSPTGAESDVLALHVPGEGNRPCMRTGSTDPALSPGLAGGGSFNEISSGIDRFSANRARHIFGRMPASGSREGIWRLCDGAPRALATTDLAGPLGPDVGNALAQFSSFSARAPLPTGNHGLMFFAESRVPPASGRTGLFHHDGVANRGIVYNEPSGYYGPNWPGVPATWRTFDTGSLTVSHDHAAFIAGLDTEDGGDPTGLWRVRAGERPELVALIGLTASGYAPEAGRTWRGFDSVAVLANGDIVVDARTNPDDTRDLWLLRRNEAPRRLLSNGQPLTLQTTQGAVQTTVTSFTLPDGGVMSAGGGDSWIGADGTLLVSAYTANHGRVLISMQLDVPDPNILLVADFE